MTLPLPPHHLQAFTTPFVGGGEDYTFLSKAWFSNVRFQKISTPTQRMVIGKSEVEGVSIAKNFKRKCEAQLEIPGGWGKVQTQKASLGEVWIFLGTTQGQL